MRRLLASALALIASVLAPAASAAPASVAAGAVDDGVLAVHVMVPLCDNDQIDCGGARAGDPDDLEHNLYWGAVFGHKRYFGRKASLYALVSSTRDEAGLLERAVFRRKASGKAFGKDGEIEVLVVIDAVHGARIDDAVDRFYRAAERGEKLKVSDAGEERELEIDVVGYAGHNRMMDGKKPPAALGAEDARRRPIPSFVLACDSRGYFQEPLEARGSTPVVLTRDLMAPEGYVLEAVVDGLSRNEDRAAVRRRVVRAYAKWQRIEEKVAGGIFAKLD